MKKIILIFILILLIVSSYILFFKSNTHKLYNQIFFQNFKDNIIVEYDYRLYNGPLNSRPFGIAKIKIAENLINKDSLKKHFWFYKKYPLNFQTKEVIENIIEIINNDVDSTFNINFNKIKDGFWVYKSEPIAFYYIGLYDRRNNYFYLIYRYGDRIPNKILIQE